jgi:hypothetical protein
MTWQRRLKEIALAGGLAGGCATNVAATGGSTGTGGNGTTGATGSTGGAGTTTFMGAPCNANPDPCCLCSPSGQGGYGGASCVANNYTQVNNTKVTCQDELSCIAAPTALCCQPPLVFNCAGQNACRDAGFWDSGCP